MTVEKADCFPAVERLPCLVGRGLDHAAPPIKKGHRNMFFEFAEVRRAKAPALQGDRKQKPKVNGWVRGSLEKGNAQKFQMLFSSPRRRARKSAAICGVASQSGKVTR